GVSPNVRDWASGKPRRKGKGESNEREGCGIGGGDHHVLEHAAHRRDCPVLRPACWRCEEGLLRERRRLDSVPSDLHCLKPSGVPHLTLAPAGVRRSGGAFDVGEGQSPSKASMLTMCSRTFPTL